MTGEFEQKQQGKILEQHEDRRAVVYEPFSAYLDTVLDKIKSISPERWWFVMYHELRTLQNSIDSGTFTLSLEAKDFAQDLLVDVINLLKEKAQHRYEVSSTEDHLSEARKLVHQISELLSFPADTEAELRPTIVSLEALLQGNERMNPNYSFDVVESDGVEHFRIFSSIQNTYFDFPLPPSHEMLHKGGFPRVVLKIWVGSPTEIIEAELPPNDFDVIASGDEEEAYSTAQKIGVTSDGVEMVHNIHNAPALFASRDITLNQCFIGIDGLEFSDAARIAAQTGHIAAIPSLRGLYGRSMFYYQNELLANGRDMYRLIKFVAEKKALSFDFTELNKQVDIGIYALVLIQKSMRKENAPELLENIFTILKQMGQVQPGEETLDDVVARLKEQYPFFDFQREPLDDEGVAKWLFFRLKKQAELYFRAKYAIPSRQELERKPGDMVPFTVSL